MWAGCIWVPIYEVMTRKHLKMVTLEENLEMAADIGIDATTSLDEAFAEAMERHGPDAKVIVLPFARYQLPREHRAAWRPSRCASRRKRTRGLCGARRALTQQAVPESGARHDGRGSGLARDPRLDDDRRAPAHVPRRRSGAAHVPAPLGVRPLRGCLPRAAHDGGEAPEELAARRCSRPSGRSSKAGRATTTSRRRRGESPDPAARRRASTALAARLAVPPAIRAGTPATTVRSGTGFVTTAPAAATASAPMSHPQRIVTPAPTQLARPTLVSSTRRG